MATIPFFLDDVDFQIIHNLEDLISFSSISKIFEWYIHFGRLDELFKNSVL
jgi:hypothetical protein